MSAHTPGPGYRPPSIRDSIDEIDCELIAEREANATLRALNADLVAACEALLHEVERLELKRYSIADPDAIDAARAAIKKARGGQ